MAGYIIQNGETVLQLDDGSIVKLVALVPTANGLQVALTATQLTALTPPANPTEFPLPATQLAALTPPANPTTFPLPASQLTALTPPANPTEFPLPATQAGWLQGLRDRLLSFVRGAGDYNGDTLRVVIATNQPELSVGTPGAAMFPISLSGSGATTILTPAAGKRLRISSIQLQSPVTTRFRFLAGTQALSNYLEFDLSFDKDFPEPVVLPIDAAFRIDIDAATPNSVSGFVVAREV
jgi:hypothetical protein